MKLSKQEKIRDCDYILHGGDISSKETFESKKGK